MPAVPHDALYLALDQGGHASRALIFDRRGEVAAAAAAPIDTAHPSPERIEHDAEQIVTSLRHALAEAVRQIGAARPLIAGLATQRSSIVCWDRRDGRALSPVISWQDRRAAAWLAQFAHIEPMVRRKTGLVLSPHYGASKLRWCLDHLSAVRDARETPHLAMGPLASFLIARLTREADSLVDPANASRTLLFNLETADWDDELIRRFGLPAQVLPRCVPSRHRYGHIDTPHGAVPLTVVTGDQPAALFGFGPPARGDTFVNLGTGAFIQRVLGAPPTPSRLLTGLAYDDGHRRLYTLEGTVNGAGSALAWACAELAFPEREAVSALAEWLSRVTSPPLFINAVAGLGSPYWHATLRPRFIGEGDAAAKLVAVIESIVFLLQTNIEAMSAVTQPSRRALIVTGGLSRLDGLCQSLADVSGVTVRRPAAFEATARGLACLVAGSDATFTVVDAAEFSPQENAPLIARYRAWRSALERLLMEST